MKNNQRFFYAYCSETKEMALTDNQSQFARDHNCNQGIISECLRGERREHKGWRFTLIEHPHPFVAAEKKKKSVILETEPVLQKPTPIQKKESDARHMDAATAAGIRHLMEDFYPGWVNTKDTGHLFITD